MRYLISFFLIASIAFFPQYSDAKKQKSENIESILKQRADNWDIAIVSKNREAIAANMSESYFQIDSNGAVLDKQAFVDEIMADNLTIEPYKIDDYKIRVYGDTAIINGSVNMHGTYNGEPYNSHFRYTDVYIKENGQWRIVSMQTTKIKQ